MPLALLLAILGSLVVHGVALFGTDYELFGSTSEPLPLQAELRPLPALPAVEPVKSATLATPRRLRDAAAKTPMSPQSPSAPVLPAETVPDATSESPPEAMRPASAPQAPATPVLPASGVIRFVIIKSSLGLTVGRAEHRWEFAGDGSYRLLGITETSGLAALLKPVRIEVESRGRMVAGGLQPDSYRTLKNGRETTENADFSWFTAEGPQVALARDGSVRAIAPGTQDLLSLPYQLAYLGSLPDGSSLGVVTGKKYERYALDSLGEEVIETPAGKFRTLHLRAMTDSVTEIWVALDRQRLPVKIRFTDRKGDSFEQIVTEFGSESESTSKRP